MQVPSIQSRNKMIVIASPENAKQQLIHHHSAYSPEIMRNINNTADVSGFAIGSGLLTSTPVANRESARDVQGSS